MYNGILHIEDFPKSGMWLTSILQPTTPTVAAATPPPNPTMQTLNSQPDFYLPYLGEVGRGRRHKEILRYRQEVPYLQRGLVTYVRKKKFGLLSSSNQNYESMPVPGRLHSLLEPFNF